MDVLLPFILAAYNDGLEKELQKTVFYLMNISPTRNFFGIVPSADLSTNSMSVQLNMFVTVVNLKIHHLIRGLYHIHVVPHVKDLLDQIVVTNASCFVIQVHARLVQRWLKQVVFVERNRKLFGDAVQLFGHVDKSAINY